VERYAGRYEGPQYVGIDLHRRRRVLVRRRDAGELLEAVQIVNSPLALAEVMARAGNTRRSCWRRPTGGYWATDTLAECGAVTHLAHPLGLKVFEYRRVKNDLRDALEVGVHPASTASSSCQCMPASAVVLSPEICPTGNLPRC